MLIQREWVERMPLGMLVPHYLMASLLYYQRNVGPMTDDAFDRCCQLLDQHWDLIEHPHKYLVDRSALSATTGYNIRWRDCPRMLQIASSYLLQSVQAGTIYNELSPRLVPSHGHASRLSTQNAPSGLRSNVGVLRRRASPKASTGAANWPNPPRDSATPRGIGDSATTTTTSLLRRRARVGLETEGERVIVAAGDNSHSGESNTLRGVGSPSGVLRRSRAHSLGKSVAMPSDPDVLPAKDTVTPRLVRRVGRTR